MAVNNIVKRIQNIMRSDAGINGDAQRIEQMTWMFFLKVYDTQEETWEYKASKDKREYKSIIPEPLRWRNWAVDKKDGQAMTGDKLLGFVNNVLFSVIKGNDADYKGETIKGIIVTADTPRSKSIVRETFADLNQYMKDGTLLRQVVNIVDEIEFDDADDRHTFGDIYEGILKDLQSAGHAGEFYTPRALTDFIVQMLNPRLGETFGDFTSGTGGFLTSALNYLAPQVKSTADNDLLQKAVIGQEWKPLPYLLSITNLLLHDIEAPNIRHCDSLGMNIGDIREKDKVEVIGMNPPYGGSTGVSVQSNFPTAYRSSETADLFIALIMYRLKAGGRCGVIIPDGFLFGTDAAKLAIKETLLRKFNLHTVIRLPGSIFAPYTPIATNILFFNNETAEGAAEGFKTKDVWFYRLDMPKGYKHFSKTKPMKLEHTQPIQDWWIDRKEIINEEQGEKSKVFTAQQLIEMDCNFDQCKFPKNEEEVLPPEELLRNYWQQRQTLEHKIDKTLTEIQNILGIEIEKDYILPSDNTYKYDNAQKQLDRLNADLPEALKKSILQEAIQGKLVPQDPKDEPASVLLESIRKEKERLFKEGKLKKKDLVTTPITEDEKPFEIPKTWEWVRLGGIFIVNPKVVSKDNNKAAFIPIDKIKAGYGSSFTYEVKQWGSIRKNYTCFADDDVAFAKITPCFQNRKSMILKGLPNGIGAGTSELKVLRPYMEIIDRKYLLYFIKSSYFIEEAVFKGTANQQRISAGYLENKLFPLPPLAEQHRIVEKIEELFTKLK